MTVFAGASLRRLGVHLHLRRVRGHPGPHHLLRHRLAHQQRRPHLQVTINNKYFYSGYATLLTQVKVVFFSLRFFLKFIMKDGSNCHADAVINSTGPS